MASFVADAIRDTSFGQQIGGYLTNEPSDNQSVTTTFTYIYRHLISLNSSLRIYAGNINFNLQDDLEGRLKMANLFQTYTVTRWDGFVTTYWPDAYVQAGSEILVLAAPYSRSPLILSGSSALVTGINIANLPGATTKIIRGTALQNGREQGNAIKILNTEPMYSMVTRSAGNADTSDNGQAPASRPLQLQYIDGADNTTWQVGLWQVENLTSNFVTSVIEVTFYAKVTIKFEGIRWGISVWPHPTSINEYLLCHHCGHKAVVKGSNYQNDSVCSAQSSRSHRNWDRRVCSRQEEPLSLLSEVLNQKERKTRHLHSKINKRNHLGSSYKDKTLCRDLFGESSTPEIQELHDEEGQGAFQTPTKREDAHREQNREDNTPNQDGSQLHRDTGLIPIDEQADTSTHASETREI